MGDSWSLAQSGNLRSQDFKFEIADGEERGQRSLGGCGDERSPPWAGGIGHWAVGLKAAFPGGKRRA
ncbi:hypothetical protein SBV1_270008 [Verrucomicrobia bacterium]|nr:hypothetical protein SBV1_270008 [Verrucomicrobiota bacterium]